MSKYASLNGKMGKEETISISVNNRAFRYGDGFFETMKMINGELILSDLHFERLLLSLSLLHFTLPAYLNASYLLNIIKEVAAKNGHHLLGRIRLTIFRGDGGLYDDVNNFPHHLIQTWPLSPSINKLNDNGLIVDIYREATKAGDTFSGIKSNNYLPYVLGSFWAKKEKLNDCILLDPFGNIADATIANVFIVKNGVVTTPPLSNGPVNGVMRKYLLRKCNETGINITENSLTVHDLNKADEVFLTNAIYGIRWVKQCGPNTYSNATSRHLYNAFLQPLFK